MPDHDEQQRVQADPAHRYFHMMLNMADDELDPFEYRLLGHYLRWAGHGGTQREGIRQTAQITQMSIDKIRSVRQSLAQKGYVILHEATEQDIAQGIATAIEIVDRWAENVTRYTPVRNSARGGVRDSAQGSEGRPVQDSAHIEEQREEQKDTRPPAAQGSGSSFASVNDPDHASGTVNSNSREGESYTPLARKILFLTGKRSMSAKQMEQLKRPVVDWSNHKMPDIKSPHDLFENNEDFQRYVEARIKRLMYRSEGRIATSKVVDAICDYFRPHVGFVAWTNGAILDEGVDYDDDNYHDNSDEPKKGW